MSMQGMQLHQNGRARARDTGPNPQGNEKVVLKGHRTYACHYCKSIIGKAPVWICCLRAGGCVEVQVGLAQAKGK